LRAFAGIRSYTKYSDLQMSLPSTARPSLFGSD
jgi:hypothetical protein